MSQTKLTPLPHQHESKDFSFDVCKWYDRNREALMAIYAAQEPQAMTTQQPEPVTRGEFDRLLETCRELESWHKETDARLDALEARQPQTPERAEYKAGNGWEWSDDRQRWWCPQCGVTRGPAPETPSRSWHIGTCPHSHRNTTAKTEPTNLASDDPEGHRQALADHQHDERIAKQTPEPKPKCGKCGDTKLQQPIYPDAGFPKSLCPCVKVGDVVSAEVYDLLPVGSRVTQVPTIDEFEYYCERRDAGWFVVDPNHDEPMNMERRERRILRIGPAPATGDVPGKAEEIAREIESLEVVSMNGGVMEQYHTDLVELLRKKHVGQPIPLADLLADPRLRPLVDVVQAAMNHANYGFTTRYILRKVCDALPPELRAAVEGVR